MFSFSKPVAKSAGTGHGFTASTSGPLFGIGRSQTIANQLGQLLALQSQSRLQTHGAFVSLKNFPLVWRHIAQLIDDCSKLNVLPPNKFR
jgi:hypothetical protein